MKIFSSVHLALSLLAVSVASAKDWASYEGKSGPGEGKHIVFLAGDEEYRSEEGLPMLAKILSQRHGFKCTVLFSIDENGFINPNTKDNQPGLQALESADLCIMLLRFRQWPDSQMKYFVDYYLAGKPFIALRTSTHAFNYDKSSSSPYAKFSTLSREWENGFGAQVLGETWVNHWGKHGFEATRGVIEKSTENHVILRGVKDIFGDTDVYEANPPPDVKVLVRGQVLKGMKADSEPADYRKKNQMGIEQGINDPMQPVVWVREKTNESGKVNQVVTTTMGSSTDLQNEGLRRLLINAAYWAVGLESKISDKANVDYVGEFRPLMYGFNGGVKGLKPVDYELK